MASGNKIKHNIKNKQKEIAAENIDNTAAVKDILENLYHKRFNPVYTFYCHNVRQRRTVQTGQPNVHFMLPGHPLYVFDDEWDGGLDAEYFEEFNYKCTMPKIISPVCNIMATDPITDYIKLKKNWQHKITDYKKSFTICKKKVLDHYENLNDEVIHCPKAVVDLAAHLDNDPDPYFNGWYYNWYYAGNGNLQLICVNWVDYLLYSQSNNLYLTRFHVDNSTLVPTYEAIFDCGVNIHIFETICSTENIIALRTKFKIFILKIVDTCDGVRFEQLKVTESELPFTAISFDDYHKNILYLTTLENKLTIVNLDRMKGRSVILKGKSRSYVDNWNTVIGSERTYYTHVDKKTLTIYDKRTNKSVHAWSAVRDVVDDVFCNDITAAKQTPGSNSMYFCTDHHLFTIDLRRSDTNKPKILQRWTHGMQCTPTYVSISNFEMNKQIICLSSQWCEDVCVVPNYDTKVTEMKGVTMPYRPPNIFNTLKEARENVMCLDIYNPIDGRLSTSISGTKIIEQGEKYNILLLNSLGDVSSHTLYPEHMEMFIDDDSPQCLHEWSKSFILERKHFELKSIIDVKNIWKELKKVPEHYTFGEGSNLSGLRSKYNEQEIHDAFESGELDTGLLDVWTRDPNDVAEQANVEDTNTFNESSAFNLLFSDSE